MIERADRNLVDGREVLPELRVNRRRFSRAASARADAGG
jgi:hypothetical protein